MEPRVFRVKDGRKTYSFKVPEQADDLFADNESKMLTISKGKQLVMAFNKWDNLVIDYEDGAIV